jgi:hypothetical protein
MKDPSKRATPSPVTERKGINAVEAAFLDFGWLFREQTISDFGLDAHVEVTEDGKPTGKLIALQIKSGSSHFRKRGDGYVFRGDLRHLEYWTNHSLPVFIILHNPDDGLILWQKVERRLATVTDKGWSISIPADHVLDRKSKQYFENGIADDEEAIRRFYFAIDSEVMTLFAEKEQVYFKIDKWINKSLSIRGIEVFFDEPHKPEPDMGFGYWAAGYSIFAFMQRRFPWLIYEYAEPVENHAGEVDVHLLGVTLTEQAKMFLALETFFKTGEPHQDEPTPPRNEDEWDEDQLNELYWHLAIEKDDT